MFWCLRWRVCLIYCSSANNYLFGPSLVLFSLYLCTLIYLFCCGNLYFVSFEVCFFCLKLVYFRVKLVYIVCSGL